MPSVSLCHNLFLPLPLLPLPLLPSTFPTRLFPVLTPLSVPATDGGGGKPKVGGDVTIGRSGDAVAVDDVRVGS